MRKKTPFKLKGLYKSFLWMLLVLVLLGSLAQYLYVRSSNQAISMSEVNNELLIKEKSIDAKLEEVTQYLLEGSFESLKYSAFEKLAYTLLVYDGDELIFWSDNKIVPEKIESERWRLYSLSNVYSLVKSKKVDNFNIITFLPIKHNYPYENDVLVNSFLLESRLDKSIQFTTNNPTSPYAVFSNDNYLFTFELPDYPIYNRMWGKVALILFSLSFLLFFYLLAHYPFLFGVQQISFKHFIIVLLSSAVLVFSLIWLGVPRLIFYNEFFTAFEFSSNRLLDTHTHLTMLVIYFFSVVYLFTYHVRIDKKRFWKQNLIISRFFPLLLASLYFILIFKLMLIIVFNSSTGVQLQSLSEVSFILLWNHLIFLGLGVTYFFLHMRIHQLILSQSKLRSLILIDSLVIILVATLGYFRFQEYGFHFLFSYVGLHIAIYISLQKSHFIRFNWNLVTWLMFFIAFLVLNFHLLNTDKKFQKFQILAQNYHQNDPNEEDKIAIAMLNDLDKTILGQKQLKQINLNTDSIAMLNYYINNQIMHGFWNKYSVRVFAVEPNSELDNEYAETLNAWGRKHQNSHFYILNNPNSDISFIGKYILNSQTGELIHLYLELYKQKYFKSYSYPNLLLDEEPNILADLNLSSARYSYRRLVSSSGNYRYNPGVNWIEKRKENYFMQYTNSYNHYVYLPDAYNVFVVSEKQSNKHLILFLHYVYTVLISVVFVYLVRLLYRYFHARLRISYTFSYKFLFTFTLMMILSFAAILYVSVGYMKRRYVEEQKEHMSQTKTYIQNLLQEKYAWNESLDHSMQNDLILELQELAYIYQTDIHVYNNNGELVASSQMPLFTRELVSKFISPIPFYADLKDVNIEEQIGNLTYQVAYTDFYNMDFLPIGYIAIPQFFSDDKIQSDLENFFTVIFNIYLLILLLFFFLSAFIGRQLTVPLVILQDSLKQIRFGQKNKKINYKPQDEIRQLVDQYNRTVDELEKSAELLAQSERETAWKSMARQVAHEINNPLTPMKLTIQQLQRRKHIGDEGFDDYFDKSATMLVEQIENLSRIAGSFSSFAKLPEAKLVKVELVNTVFSVARLFENMNENISFTYQSEVESIDVYADHEQLIQVFNNLIKNAMQAIPSSRKGVVEIGIKRYIDEVRVSVKDNGDGVSEEDRIHIFSPNFTTKSSGMGLGLAISRNIIRYMGGDIYFKSKIGKGTTFIVSLPCMKEMGEN